MRKNKWVNFQFQCILSCAAFFSVSYYITLLAHLQEELGLKKYELNGLQAKGKQLCETDPSQQNVVKGQNQSDTNVA